MCFYYAITKKGINALVKGKIIRNDQLSLFDEKYIVNGFDHPFMPVITDESPESINFLKWGFLPSTIDSVEQANDFLGKYNTLNAKSEEVNSSHLYEESFYNRRCLVLCSGFFEWRKVKKEKVPYYISLKDDEMFVFAGIWNETTDGRGHKTRTFSVLTIEANELMAKVHNTKIRMPLILSPDDAQKWLQKGLDKETLNSLLKPIPSEKLKAHTIKKFLPAQAKNLNTSDIIAYYSYPEIFGLMSEQETML
ncbi:MAG: SOS response-associated peptidase [Bacteroidales bacterium]|nr:MAG: SOS response-associated peptidase [Bacteroidales bacterium]